MSDTLGVYDNTIGTHRISFVVKDNVLEWIIIGDAHFTVDQFEEMIHRFWDFTEEAIEDEPQPGE